MDTNSIKLVPFETFMESVEATRSEDPFYQEGRLTRFWDNVKNDLGFSKSEDNSNDWDDEDGETPQKKESIIKRVLAILKKIVTAIFKFIPTIVKNLTYIEPKHFKGKGANAEVYIMHFPFCTWIEINHELNAWVEPLNPDKISSRLAKGIEDIYNGNDFRTRGITQDADMKTRLIEIFFPHWFEPESNFSKFCKEIDNPSTWDDLNGQMLSIARGIETYKMRVSDLCESINRGISIEKTIKNNFKNYKPPVVEMDGGSITINGRSIDIPLDENSIKQLNEINRLIPQIFAEYAAKVKKLLEYHNMYIVNMSAAINKIDSDVLENNNPYKEYVI